MKLTFIGATRTVTGSCYLLQTDGRRILVDCGLYQGGRELEGRNRAPFPFAACEIDAVALTHAHIDHSGLLPRLVAEGFKGPIHCHRATADLAGVMLRDSAHIQELHAQQESRKRERRGLEPVGPVYSQADAEAAIKLLSPLDYGRPIQIADGAAHVEFADAGHILGSSSVRFTIAEPDGPFCLLFSGDVGNAPTPILNDPVQFDGTDAMLIESTYGDRLHEGRTAREDRLAQIVEQVAQTRGTLLIPAFAVGRTQEILYSLSALLREGKIPAIPIFIDSPMASEATEVFRRHPECFDREMRQRLARDDDPLSFPGLELVRGQQESMELNNRPGPKVIVAGAGMCNAGRIVHHLKHNLWRRDCVVLFVGFQGEGTLGRALSTGAKVVQIMGEGVRVQARIEQIPGFSAHADQNGLLAWLGRMAAPPRRVFVIHGEEESSLALAAKIDLRFGPITHVPQVLETAEMTGRTETFHAPPPAPGSTQVVLPHLALDWSNDLHSFFDEVISRGKLLARDGRAIRGRLGRDRDGAGALDKVLAKGLTEFRSKIDRILADLAGR